MKPLPVAIAAGLWIASVAGAYWFGHRGGFGPGRTDRVTGVKSEDLDGTPGKPRPLGAKATVTDPRGGAPSGNAPGGGLTLQQILAQVKAAMRSGGMNNPSTAIKTLTLLAQIRPEDVPEALKAAEEMKEPQARMMLYMVLLSQWAERDGPAALKYADENLSKQGPMVQMARMGVLSAWAQSDPDAAWAHIQQNADSEEGDGPMGGRPMMMMGLFSSLAAKDPEKAFARLAELTDKQERSMALNGIAQTSFDDASRQRLMDEISKLPEADERKEARASVLGQLAMIEPDQAIALTAALPADERSTVSNRVGSMLMMTDPKRGAEVMIANAPEGDRTGVYTQITSQWAAQDPNAAGVWLGQQPQTPELDGARDSFATTVANRDPESAMAWAGTITDEERRAQTIGRVYQTWKRKDEGAANSAIEASGLPQARIDAIRSGTPTGDSATEVPAPVRVR